MPKGISIEQFCSRNKVPHNINEDMTAEEQKRYINYLAERVNAADLENRAMKLVLQDFLDEKRTWQDAYPNWMMRFLVLILYNLH